MRYLLVARTGHPDFLDLPWDRPLAEWETERLAHVPRGISRHVVRFVRYGDDLYAIKELPKKLADREYRLLGHLAEEGLPVVEVVGVVSERHDPRADEPLEAALITRHLAFSLPYRLLFSREQFADLHDRLVDALADLLVRLHLAGFLWGDCSLSNTLFRRDAGALAAYLVDAETSELHPELTAGQRAYDLEIAVTNVAGELADLQAASLLAEDLDPFEVAPELRARYQRLWDELTREEVFGTDERYRINERLRRLNELGFDVGEVELVGSDDTQRLVLHTRVVDKGHHRRRLRELTGLDVQEEQARRLLNDIASFGACVQRDEGRELSEKAIALRWLDRSFEPSIAAVPDELRGKREPAQVFHEILDHWYFLSEVEGQDLDFAAATRSYVANVLRFVPDERILVDEDGASPSPG